MKVIGYTIVHYGVDYLSYAVRSVLPLVDKHLIFFTPHPSHGTLTDLPPIESQAQLLASVPQFDKIQWYHMSGIYHEGKQRDTALQHCIDKGADLILVVDCDEIWHQETLGKAIDQAAQSGYRDNLINFTHLWRSFNWCCRDQGWPVRLINPHLAKRGNEYHFLNDIGEIHHFGYAVRDKIMRYKWAIHGHKRELRRGWLDQIWTKWPPPPDCHPTNDQNFWMPEPFDKATLPELLRSHPFYNLEMIE